MLETFQNNLFSIVPHPENKKFLLAVSGGIDSMVMAHLFYKSGLYFGMAHCNFMLRNRESDEDENFVQTLALKYKVPFFVKQFETSRYAKKNKMSLQMAARELRYGWFNKMQRENGFDLISIAHNSDDILETFFINLLRGTGIGGLHGIRAIDGNIIRPLLIFPREEIQEYAATVKLKWREDSSNASYIYQRNKIRHKLIPLLEELSPSAKKSILLTIDNLKDTEVVFHKEVERQTMLFQRREGNRIKLEINKIKTLYPTALYLYEALKQYGFNYLQAEKINSSLDSQPGKSFLSGTHRLLKDRDFLLIEKRTFSSSGINIRIRKSTQSCSIDGYKINFSTQPGKKGFVIPNVPYSVALDCDKLTFPLFIRRWKAGDKFFPLGMQHSKKVSDFLIDNKVAIPDKERVFVLVSGTEIAWVIGLRPSEKYKITDETKYLYLCTIVNT